MEIKVEQKDKQASRIVSYPVLKSNIENGSVVLFVDKSSGIVLRCNIELFVGKFFDDFVDCDCAKTWSDFNGEITLKNEK